MRSDPEEFSLKKVYPLVESKNFPEKLNTATNTSSDELRITHSTISSWVYWLAADLVAQWRSLPVEEWDISTIFQEFNPELTCGSSLLLDRLSDSKTSNSSFVEALNTQFEEAYQPPFQYFSSSGIVKWLIPATAKLTNCLTEYLQSCLEQLELNINNLRVQLHQKQQIYFYSLKSGGSTEVFACLNCLSEKLRFLASKYDLQSQECLYKSNASRHSFENLSAQVSHFWEFSKQQKAEGALNALRLIYKYKMLSQLYNAAYQLLKSLEAEVEKRIIILNEVERYLDSLQCWYGQQYSLLPVNAAFLKHYLSPRINAIKFLQEIEEWAGNTRYDWATSNVIEIAVLRKEILIRLQPFCCEFYAECFQVKHKLSNELTDIEK